MVQIILIFKPHYIFTININLYIPHGSDNTFPVNRRSMPQLLLYIPHGSDNTHFVRLLFLLSILTLYIPHGSDNTRKEWLALRRLMKYFISHMVQIIQDIYLDYLYFEIVFISHMVQIIPTKWTWIRESPGDLYIPHGSDNTQL